MVGLDDAAKSVLVAGASCREQLSLLQARTRCAGDHSHQVRRQKRSKLIALADEFVRTSSVQEEGMARVAANRVVHVELQTGNLPRACAFYTRLFGWHAETIHLGSQSYLALELGSGIQGGVVERDTERALWLPYVEVADITEATERAIELGASVLLEPREGPAGWRNVVAAPAGAEIALWQPKA